MPTKVVSIFSNFLTKKGQMSASGAIPSMLLLCYQCANQAMIWLNTVQWKQDIILLLLTTQVNSY